MNIHELEQGTRLNNNELCSIFKCSSQGGMRRSKETNSLLLIANHIESLYDDRWENDIFYYTGMGQKGDQSLNFSQNKTLNTSFENNINVYLFEVFEKHVYTFQGRVILIDIPYQEMQPDNNSNLRKVWIFPLKLIEGTNYIPKQVVPQSNTPKKRKKLSISNLKTLVENNKPTFIGNKNRTTHVYNRNKYIIDYALERAKGFCQLCDQPAPFKNKIGDPFLEVHHVVPLSKGGTDTYDNVVALRPNCHRQIHILSISKDIAKLKNAAYIKLS